MAAIDKEILDRLSNIHLDVRELHADHRALSEKVEEIKEDVAKVDHTLNGNGKPGLRIEVDRLKQDAARRQWLNRAIIGVVLTIIVWLITGQ